MFHSSETVDLIMRGFCALIPTQKLSHLVNVDDNCIGDFFRIFRNLIYERQLNELLNFYFINPQQGRLGSFLKNMLIFIVTIIKSMLAKNFYKPIGKRILQMLKFKISKRFIVTFQESKATI